MLGLKLNHVSKRATGVGKAGGKITSNNYDVFNLYEILSTTTVRVSPFLISTLP